MMPRIRPAKSCTRRPSWLSRASVARCWRDWLVWHAGPVVGRPPRRLVAKVRQFDEPGLVDVDQTTAFGLGNVDLAVEPGEFGS
jgi:hypothetical protein